MCGWEEGKLHGSKGFFGTCSPTIKESRLEQKPIHDQSRSFIDREWLFARTSSSHPAYNASLDQAGITVSEGGRERVEVRRGCGTISATRYYSVPSLDLSSSPPQTRIPAIKRQFVGGARL